jgi:hypothetical protein
MTETVTYLAHDLGVISFEGVLAEDLEDLNDLEVFSEEHGVLLFSGDGSVVYRKHKRLKLKQKLERERE